jgi:PAS domain S-box-containing protein
VRKLQVNSDRLVRIAFGTALVFLFLIGILTYRIMTVAAQSDQWVKHSRRVADNLDNMRYAMTSIQASSAGFLLTGDESYLEVWRSSMQNLRDRAATVRSLTSDNPTQQASLPALDAIILRRLQLGERVVALRRTAGLEIAAAEVGVGRGRAMTAEFVRLVQKMQDEEARLLVRRTARSREDLQKAQITLIAGTVLGLLITAAAGGGVIRNNARRRLVEESLRCSEDQYRTLLSETKESGAKYRGLMEAAPDAMVVVNQSGEIVLLNLQAESQFGYHRDELLGQKVSSIVPEGFAERLLADGLRSAEEALAQQIGTGIELTARRKDGSEFPIEIMLSPLRSPEGILITAAIRDISVRKAAETHLAQMESRYRGLLEAAPDAMLVVNQGGEIVLLNLQAEKKFGYRRDELLGQKVTNIIPEGFAERLIADGLRSAEEALAQHIGTGIELTARRKDGSEFPMELMLSPLGSEDGILVTAAIRDISVRKAAETHLAQMESRYRGLLEAAPDAMVVVNQGGEIVLLNLQAEKKFGYRRDELLGQKVTNIIPEGFAERLIADGLRSAEEALAQQIGTGIELTARRKDGSEFPMELMLSPLGSDRGILVTAAIRDITTRRTAEALLLQKVKELYRSNEELQQFAYIASHDLQEPLRMVASYTTLIARRYKGKLDADADDFIAFAVDGAKRMQRLIQDLLAYSRVGSKGEELFPTSSEEALEQAIRNLRGAMEESDALVTHDPLPVVMADETQLTQLFQNLVGNAIKYRRGPSPSVHVAAAPCDGRRWSFSVRDNGLGIEPQYFERIFGMFQRLHKRDEFAGTGIGLAICKKIIERHGGAISVESVIGQGSTFRFQMTGG